MLKSCASLPNAVPMFSGSGFVVRDSDALTEDGVVALLGGVATVDRAGIDGVSSMNEHVRSIVVQLTHIGLVSSHFTWRRLHSLQPVRDFR
jgi:hypothetical protein